MAPTRFLLVDIDGLRSDVFSNELKVGRLPNFARLFGSPNLEKGLVLPALAPAPSITFTSQASLVTGSHPREHGIPGNQFFDRFGWQSQGTARHLAFDVGDTLAVDDAVRVFSDGLASRYLQAPTIYEYLRQKGLVSVVAGHMYAGGAASWLRPPALNLARLTKGKGILKIDAGDFDRHTLKQTLEELDKNGLPDLLTVYFMGVDHESHEHGPQAQAPYLVGQLDPLLGELIGGMVEVEADADLFCMVVSDHGQIAVPPDDRHSLRLAFPFERELGKLFDGLGLDVHDLPGEDPNSDAVVGSNGGLAHVYLRSQSGKWSDSPGFDEQVLPLGKAFWEANRSGKYAAELEGALSGVLVRSVEKEGWYARYYALTPQGEVQTLTQWFSNQPANMYSDPVNRLDNLVSPPCGDLLLVSNYRDGFYFASPLEGMHGGLHPEDSNAVLAFGWQAASNGAWEQVKSAIAAAIHQRCSQENGRQPSTADLWVGLKTVVHGF